MPGGSQGPRAARLALGFFVLFAAHAAADIGISLSSGQSQDSEPVWRFDFRNTIDRTLWTSIDTSLRLEPQWDIAYTRWSSIDVDTVSVSPVLRLTKILGETRFFLDGGIGLAWFSRTKLKEHTMPHSLEPASRDLGSRLNFEDRLGAGIMFGNGAELGIRLFHYSNADFELPNDGINAYYLNAYFPF